MPILWLDLLAHFFELCLVQTYSGLLLELETVCFDVDVLFGLIALEWTCCAKFCL